MRNIELHLPGTANLAKAEKAMDVALAELGLEVPLRGSLKKFPGCVHWHARTPSQPGTLEVTLWPQERRAWITIQSGRTAAWIDNRLPEIRTALSRQLAVR